MRNPYSWNSIGLLLIISSCGVDSSNGRTSGDQNFSHESNSGKSSNEILSTVAASGNHTVSTISADQMHGIALSQLEESGSKWSPVFGDRFSLMTAGIIPFPSHHGNISYQPTIFQSLIPANALRPSANSANCRAPLSYSLMKDCPNTGLCKNILTNLSISNVSDESVKEIYQYLIGDDLGQQELTDLKTIAQKSEEQSIYSPMEIVCFAIMQTPQFLTY
jgi:hypothetical protein